MAVRHSIVKLLLLTLQPHIGVLVQVLSGLLPIQLPPIAPGKVAEDVCAWAAATHVRAWMQFQAPAFNLGPALVIVTIWLMM